MMTFDIGVLHPTTPHLFADLIEFLAVFDAGGKGELHKNDVINIVNGVPLSDDEVDDEQDFQDLDTVSDAGKNDIKESRVEDVWTHLEYRQSVLGESYPFKIEGDLIILNSDWQDPRHKVYRFLLATSRLRSFREGVRNKWSRAFAEVSAFAMRSLLPNHAVVKVFDANSEDRKNFYGSDCREALIKLGKQLCVYKVHEDEIMKRSSSGDGGIDLVGVLSFDDQAHGSHIVFGQCGAQEKNWPDKRLEAHPLLLNAYFHIVHDVITTMFTPVLFRSSTGEWEKNISVTGVVVLDRIRILNLIEKGNAFEDIAQQAYFQAFEHEFGNYSIPLR